MNGIAPKPDRKPPRRVTPAYLQRAAMTYLERYASSAENLRRVLRRKVETRCRLRGEDPAEFYEAVDDVVAKCLRAGLLDDARYAQARVATLRRRGGSARAIRAKLSLKGVDRETITAALAGRDDEEDPQAQEEQAARALARRRRLGPFRPGERAPYRDKDLAALARAGFSFDIARRIVDGERDEEEG
ncbi:regulatory protein RecX [Microvirga sp. 17 mud 1-3]|uniref:regulatory protein RecX n=1 Tax=Microvirga sp. 17 mud 1-3 TaxID=2082949 RepID=UPI000D6BCC5B|nr:regulatory protein RecX [Microvirga sp. 17 mud 1-3]AWM88810.1 RecX family transcriptional regulator [Microvirga sp. 17 mud 1-3]